MRRIVGQALKIKKLSELLLVVSIGKQRTIRHCKAVVDQSMRGVIISFMLTC